MNNTRPLRITFYFFLGILFICGCTPKVPDYCRMRDRNAMYDMCVINQNVPKTSIPLDLSDIIQIALCQNLDIKLQEIERCVYDKNYVAEKLRQLPELTAHAEYSERDNTPAWFSRSLGGPVGLLPTQSSDKTVKRIDVTAAYNILDFGLTYIKTRQEKNRACLLAQRHLRARQNLILDIYRAYYRAVVAKMAKDKAKELIKVLEKRQTELQLQVGQQIVPEMIGLHNEDRLIDMQVKLQAFENEYRSAMIELSALMGLRPGQCYEIAGVELFDLSLSPIDVFRLDEVALHYRPELFAQEMQYQIDADEVRASMLRMFPNSRIFGGYERNDDSFVFHKDWISFGATVTWDLLTLPSKWSDRKANIYRRTLAWHTRLSMSMGILTQVHLAHINVEETQSQYKLSQDLHRVKSRQYEVAKLMELRGEIDADDVIAYQVEALYAKVNALKGYANLQIALEQLGNSIGRPLYFQEIYDCMQPYGVEVRCDHYYCGAYDYNVYISKQSLDKSIEFTEVQYSVIEFDKLEELEEVAEELDILIDASELKSLSPWLWNCQ